MLDLSLQLQALAARIVSPQGKHTQRVVRACCNNPWQTILASQPTRTGVTRRVRAYGCGNATSRRCRSCGCASRSRNAYWMASSSTLHARQQPRRTASAVTRQSARCLKRLKRARPQPRATGSAATARTAAPFRLPRFRTHPAPSPLMQSASPATHAATRNSRCVCVCEVERGRERSRERVCVCVCVHACICVHLLVCLSACLSVSTPSPPPHSLHSLHGVFFFEPTVSQLQVCVQHAVRRVHALHCGCNVRDAAVHSNGKPPVRCLQGVHGRHVHCAGVQRGQQHGVQAHHRVRRRSRV